MINTMQSRQQVANQVKAMANQQKYIEHNTAAIKILEKSISDAGRNRETITYGNLFAGLYVDISPIGQEDWRRFPPPPWDETKKNELYGDMVEEFLRLISLNSFSQHGFMASALVVYATNKFGKKNKPGPEFFDLARQYNIMPQGQSESSFFKDQKNEAFKFLKINSL